MFAPIALGFGLFALYAMTYSYTIREISTHQNPAVGQKSLVED
jgi:hypothetical protein